MDLSKIEHITIGNMREFVEIVKLPMKEAVPMMDKFLTRHSITRVEGHIILEVVRCLKLYKE